MYFKRHVISIYVEDLHSHHQENFFVVDSHFPGLKAFLCYIFKLSMVSMFVFFENLIPKQRAFWQLFHMLTMLMPLEIMLDCITKKDIHICGVQDLSLDMLIFGWYSPVGP